MKDVFDFSKRIKEKIEKSKADNINELELFSESDIDSIMGKKQSFCGKNINFKKLTNHTNVGTMARLMKEKCKYVIAYDLGTVEKNKPNAVVLVDVAKHTFFSDELTSIISGMCNLSDDFGLSYVDLDDGFIRLSFGIKGIWNME